MTVNHEHLDKIAQGYYMNDDVNDRHIDNICQKYELYWVLKQLVPKGNLLELGYGDGITTAEFTEKGYDVTVIEGSENIIKNMTTDLPSRVNTMTTTP